MSALNAESKRLLDAIFGTAGNAWLVRGRYDAQDKLVMQQGGEGPAGTFDLPDGDDLYYCVSTVGQQGTRKAVERVHVLVIDDVGKEIDREEFKLFFPLTEPSFVVESSQGSFQVGFIIEGGMDPEEFKALRQAMAASGECWAGAHNISSAAIYRLPQGTHTKRSRKGWKPRLVSFSGRSYPREEVWLAAPVGAPRAPVKPKPFEWDLGEDALGELVDLIPHPLSVGRNEWVRIAHGIAGAGGDFEIFDMFSVRWEGTVDDLETQRVWDTLPESRSGGGLLRSEAEEKNPEGFAAWKQKWEAPAVFSDEAIGADEVAAAVGLDRSYSTGDFVAFLPTQRYVYLPTGDLWVKEAINSIIAPVVVGVKANGEPRTMKPAAWLDREAGVSQMSWLPGKPRVVTGMTVSPDGLRPQRAAAIYNIYRAPEVEAGDAGKAKPWLDHVRGLYPADAEHLFDFFAHAVQKPWEKVNHGALLGGAPGIGKDTMLHPVLKAVGFSNTCSISPSRIKETFNPWVRSVVLVIDELRDLGDVNQWAFYEQTKTLLAAPPMTTMINEKFKPAYPVPNVVHVVMTTNSKTDGLYLPEDDRRHYVAWSTVAGTGDKNCQPPKYFVGLWDWMDKQGGTGHVAAWLRARDLKGFDPKAPPPQTKAFRDIVGANRPVEESPIADALDLMGRPGAFTLDWLKAASTGELAGWLSEPKNRRIVPKRLEREGYEVFHNPDVDDGRWRIGPDKVIVYTDRKLTYREKETRIKGLYAAQSAAMDAIFKAGQP